MASYTTNYQLHQWVPEDDFLRTDFNEDFAKIDAAIKGVETAANTALAKKSEFILGTYEGNGTTLPVNLVFKPRLVVITAGIFVVVVGTYTEYENAYVTTSGFTVVRPSGNYSSPNVSGVTYTYLALR